MLNTVEQAYDALGKYLLSFVGSRQWESAACRLRIYAKMASGSHWLVMNGEVDESGGFEEDQDAIWTGLDAAIFLRDDLLKTTGHRIWGLTFTLYPDGKFNIEYDYDKPAVYEDTDETIDVDLSDFANPLNKK